MLPQGDIKTFILILTKLLSVFLLFLSNHNDYKLSCLFTEAVDKGKTKQKTKQNTIRILKLKEA